MGENKMKKFVGFDKERKTAYNMGKTNLTWGKYISFIAI